MDEVDPLDEYMASIDCEIATLSSGAPNGMSNGIKASPNLLSLGQEEAEEEGGEAEELIDGETLKNLSVEEIIAYARGAVLISV